MPRPKVGIGGRRGRGSEAPLPLSAVLPGCDFGIGNREGGGEVTPSHLDLVPRIICLCLSHTTKHHPRPRHHFSHHVALPSSIELLGESHPLLSQQLALRHLLTLLVAASSPLQRQLRAPASSSSLLQAPAQRSLFHTTSLRLALSADARKKIDAAVQGNPLVVFMKGTPELPMCGFSRAVCQIMEVQGVKPEVMK